MKYWGQDENKTQNQLCWINIWETQGLKKTKKNDINYIGQWASFSYQGEGEVLPCRAAVADPEVLQSEGMIGIHESGYYIVFKPKQENVRTSRTPEAVHTTKEVLFRIYPYHFDMIYNITQNYVFAARVAHIPSNLLQGVGAVEAALKHEWCHYLHVHMMYSEKKKKLLETCSLPPPIPGGGGGGGGPE